MRRPAPLFSRPRAGFTFVELVLVIMLFGVLAGVAAPRYQEAIAAVNLGAAAKRVAADLRRARSVATTTATPVTVTFDPATASYASAGLPSPDRPDATLQASLAKRGEGVAISAVDFGGAAEITFDFRGDPAAAGAVTLTRGSMTKTVSVTVAGGVEVTP